MTESSLRRAFLALFFLSGLAALIYQVLWFRVLGLVLGGTVAATVTVLASFMAGLALGARLAARLLPRIRRPLRAYAHLEVLVAVTALLSPLALEAVRRLYAWLAPDPAMGESALLPLVRIALAFLVLLVPTTALGATLPVLVGRFVERLEQAGVRVGALYAANLWGAVAGVFLAGFVVLPLVGVRLGLVLAACLTLAVALAARVLSTRVEPPPAAREAPAEEAVTPPSPLERGLLALFLATGFCSFVYEVLWTRLLVFHLGSSAYAFSLMLGLFLTGLAVGGALGGWAADRVARPLLLLAGVVWSTAAAIAYSLLYIRSLPDILLWAGRTVGGDRLDFTELLMSSALATAPMLLPATILIGMTFPLGAKALIRDPHRSGQAVGRLYAWNTLGNIAGAVVGGLLLLPLLGAQGGLLAAAALNGLAGASLLLFSPLSPGRRWALATTGAVLLALLLVPVGRGDALRAAGIFGSEEGEEREILHLEETPQGTVTVTRVTNREGTWKSLDVDGVNVAGTSPGLLAIQKLQGHLPVLLHRAPRRVLHIGFGSGGTARAVATHPEIEAIHIAEINPAVLRASTPWMKEVNEGVLDDPRIQVFHEDGRNFLLATDQAYDLILSDAVHPRYAGNSALYTVDYFRLARSRLRQDGLLSLWLPIYGLSSESFQMILRSMRLVFPDTSVWYVNSNINEFCIVVGRLGGPGIDLDRMAEALQVPAVRRDLAPIRAADPLRIVDYLAAQGDDLNPLVRGVPASRDDRPVVEYLSARTLDRTGTFIDNFRLLQSVRHPRPGLLRGERAEEIVPEYQALYPSTTANLRGQLETLLAGHAAVPAERREQARELAGRFYRRADAIAPEQDEPWEWFGLPPALEELLTSSELRCVAPGGGGGAGGAWESSSASRWRRSGRGSSCGS